MISPVKKGVRIGSFSFGFGCNNGNSNIEKEDEKFDAEEYMKSILEDSEDE